MSSTRRALWLLALVMGGGLCSCNDQTDASEGEVRSPGDDDAAMPNDPPEAPDASRPVRPDDEDPRPAVDAGRGPREPVDAAQPASGDGSESPLGDASTTPQVDASLDPLVPLVDGSRQSIEELLESEGYREPPWVAQTDEPRASSSIVSPHGDVRVFANDILLASIRKRNAVKELPDGTLEVDIEGTHDTGSVAVKEFYNEDEMIGRAVLVKLEGAQSQVAYYCEGSSQRCGTMDLPPVYGVSFGVACGACHGGLVFTVNYPGN